jgi:hypothetical protein
MNSTLNLFLVLFLMNLFFLKVSIDSVFNEFHYDIFFLYKRQIRIFWVIWKNIGETQIKWNINNQMPLSYIFSQWEPLKQMHIFLFGRYFRTSTQSSPDSSMNRNRHKHNFHQIDYYFWHCINIFSASASRQWLIEWCVVVLNKLKYIYYRTMSLK